MPKVKVSDIELSYEVMGEGPPVLLVTGIGADSLAWAFNAPMLMESYKVITVDNRGIGLSDKPQTPYTIELMADDTIGLLRRLDAGPLHLVGHSMGGMISQQVALKAPELLRSLTLVTTIARVPPASELTLNLWNSIIEKLGMEGFIDFVAMMTFTSEYIENNWEGLQMFRQMMLAHLAQNPVDAACFRRQGEAVQGHDVLDRLGEIRLPTLILGAEKDILVPIRFSEEIKSKIPDAEYREVKGVAHGLNVEQPGEFNQLLMEWFAKN